MKVELIALIEYIESNILRFFHVLVEYSFGEDETKLILIAYKHKVKNSKPLSIWCNNIKIK